MPKDFMQNFRQEKSVSKLDTRVRMRAVDELIENRENFYDCSDTNELAHSIAEHGLMQPIVVTESGVVVSGHRRLAAYKQLLQETADEKYRAIPCIVRESLDELDEQLMLIEANSTARVLSSYELMEQAKRYDALLERAKREGRQIEGRRRDKVAETFGVSKSKVARLNAIDKNLDVIWMMQFRIGEINESLAYEISKLPPKEQVALLDDFPRDDGTVPLTLTELEAWKQRQKKAEQHEKVCEEWRQKAERSEQESETYDGIETHETKNESCGRGFVGGCKHSAVMERFFVKKGVMTGCAGCCKICTDRAECEHRCDEVVAIEEMRKERGMPPRTVLSRRLKQIRNERSWKREQMAEVLGAHIDIYNAIEDGRIRSVEDVVRAALELNVSADWLLGLSEVRERR